MPDLDIWKYRSVETDSHDDLDRQLVHALVIAPRAPFRLLADVMGVSDQTIARRYRKLVSALPPPDAEVEPVSLNADDYLLVAELARDGRASHAALAAALHWHESTVRRRISELQQQHALYFDVDVHEDFLTAHLAALLWLVVEPAHLDQTGQAIARHPEVPFAAATTGQTNLVVSARFRGTRHMYHYITTRLAGLSGVRSVETSPIIARFKQAGPATPGL
jgi:DNA-binding Lrp family transcriptional regulator